MAFGFTPNKAAAIQSVSNPRGTPLTIGGVTFFDEEHPQSLPIGLSQMQAVRQMIGGGRVIHVLGPQSKPITWKGRLFVVGDTTPWARAQQLNRLHASGQVQRLTWGPFAYDVIILNFEPDFHNEVDGEYSIEVNVLRDVSGQYTASAAPSADSQTQNLFNQVQTKYNSMADSRVGSWAPLLNKLAHQLNTLGSVLALTGSQITPIVGNAAALLAIVGSYINTVQTEPTSITQIRNLAAAVGVQSNLQLIASNINSGQAPLSVQVSGGNLHRLAAAHYGDPTLWTVIAQANKLYSPVLPNGIFKTLTIPPAVSTTPIG